VLSDNGDLTQVPAVVDTGRANVARVYDYLLGGSFNFLADRDLARAITAVEPNARAFARANRDFLGRAVRFLAAEGITQFLDIGSGLPTQGNVHEITGQASPGARVAYVDADPVAVAHSKAILEGGTSAAVIAGDLRDPAAILAHETTRRLIDFGQPVGLLLIAVLHFISDADDPWRMVATLRDALPPGSYLAIGHATDAHNPQAARTFEKVYNNSSSTGVNVRSREEIRRFFDGFELVDPGLTYVSQWRPDPTPDTGPFHWGELVGVGRR
jgi:S-adenosyl methyltransferase